MRDLAEGDSFGWEDKREQASEINYSLTAHNAGWLEDTLLAHYRLDVSGVYDFYAYVVFVVELDGHQRIGHVLLVTEFNGFCCGDQRDVVQLA